MTEDKATETTFHGDPFPPPCCAHCDSRRVEAVALRARAAMLRRAISEKEVYGVVCHHAVELLAMMEARGMS